MLDWRLTAAIFLAALLVLLVLVRQWEAWRRSVRARRRGARAVRGEHAAERLLEEFGYEILERQLSMMWEIDCDGESIEFLLRADLLVRKNDQEFIAEVKTGELAPSISNASTRRQLLEYSVAFASPTILLVDVEGGEILKVRFPRPEPDQDVFTPDSATADQEECEASQDQ